MSNPTSILLVNADETNAAIHSFNLQRSGFIVHTAKDGSSALMEADQIQPSLVIIDDNINIYSPEKLSASEVCTIIKNKSSTKNIPIFLLTKEAEKYQASKNTVFAVNEIIQKPFAPSVLVTKIKNIFTPTQTTPINVKSLQYKDLVLNIGTYRVTKNGQNIHLGPTEFKILQCLMELPGKTLSREHIMKHVWGFNSQVEPRTIDVHINRLRAALKNDNEKEITLIKTVRSAGYCLSAS